ncbi:hypothetical protein [Neolewinella agarilytica]|uniref:Uncharacterized protein n=1 Tax=Neolewinella agarilytica TaxID=478744 RepID=A0A1H9HFQ7_9BACT|nr:hypothetical protein [Neolewinella agarilytica]SEQ61160.1 hypothetical protein SAMN05444359_112143 [Neolewinella agarilytica]
MKNTLVLLLLSFGLFSTTNLSAQSNGDLEYQITKLLDNFCDDYFEGCFGWRYLDITDIKEMKKLSDGRLKVTGTVRNSGWFGTTHNRKFIATLTFLTNDGITINFSKQAINGGVETWSDCRKTIHPSR